MQGLLLLGDWFELAIEDLAGVAVDGHMEPEARLAFDDKLIEIRCCRGEAAGLGDKIDHEVPDTGLALGDEGPEPCLTEPLDEDGAIGGIRHRAKVGAEASVGYCGCQVGIGDSRRAEHGAIVVGLIGGVREGATNDIGADEASGQVAHIGQGALPGIGAGRAVRERRSNGGDIVGSQGVRLVELIGQGTAHQSSEDRGLEGIEVYLARGETGGIRAVSHAEGIEQAGVAALGQEEVKVLVRGAAEGVAHLIDCAEGTVQDDRTTLALLRHGIGEISRGASSRRDGGDPGRIGHIATSIKLRIGSHGTANDSVGIRIELTIIGGRTRISVGVIDKRAVKSPVIPNSRSRYIIIRCVSEHNVPIIISILNYCRTTRRKLSI